MAEQRACEDCGISMTPEEIQFYECHCDRCERIWCARMTLWMLGKSDNSEFDKRFSSTSVCDPAPPEKT